MSRLGFLSSALWLICAAVGCSLYPETAPNVDAAAGAGATGGAGGSGGGVTGGTGGIGGEAGAPEGGTGGVVCAATQTLELTAVADSFITSNQASANHGNEELLEMSPNGGRRVILRFDLPSTLSTESAISTATLELTVGEIDDFAETIVAHRIARPWDELLVTWDTAEDGGDWTTAGGDFATLGSAAAAIPPNTAAGTKVSLDMTNDVSSFVAGMLNQGWLLKVNDQTGQNNDRVRFASREAATATDRPKLVISFCE